MDERHDYKNLTLERLAGVSNRLEANRRRMAQHALATRERAAIHYQETMVRELVSLREDAQAQRCAREAADRKTRRWQIAGAVAAFLGVAATVLVAVLGG